MPIERFIKSPGELLRWFRLYGRVPNASANITNALTIFCLQMLFLAYKRIFCLQREFRTVQCLAHLLELSQCCSTPPEAPGRRVVASIPAVGFAIFVLHAEFWFTNTSEATKKIKSETFLVYILWKFRISAFRGYLTFYFRFTGCRERCVQRRIAKPNFSRPIPRFSAKILRIPVAYSPRNRRHSGVIKYYNCSMTTQ